MPDPHVICHSNSKVARRLLSVSSEASQHLYWNHEQQLVHHTVTGCNMRCLPACVRVCASDLPSRWTGPVICWVLARSAAPNPRRLARCSRFLGVAPAVRPHRR